ncbi:MAG: Tryptophan synthase alpha chain [Labilithrix sp.]|nr:Tryptophan synthase alpha chain [Labilithrix sp.]
MRKSVFVGGLCFATAVVVACGSSTPRDFTDEPDGSVTPGGEDGSVHFVQDDGNAKPACVNLGCKQVECTGGATTSISGIVMDPAGKNPVYNVVVYVPNAPLTDIKHGAVCDSCGGAPISGSPLVTTLTDATGHFTLKNVPVMADLPVVLQIGKWRRQITLSTKPTQCQDSAITDPDRLRLPRNKSEGDLPLIALTAGCDPIHTLIQKIGIDKSEFTTPSGGGMVHAYAGRDYTVPDVPGQPDAYAFWGNLGEMMKYDIIINECECSPYKRDTKGPAYANMAAYLDAGGRVFNSHYHLNFFASDNATSVGASPELSNAAEWNLFSNGGGGGTAPFLIDTTFPKGKAMDDWLDNLKTATGWPKFKTTPKGQIETSNVGDIKGAKPGLSQRWIYPSSGESVVYVSINTPTAKPEAERCGRAVATDLHVGSGSTTTMTEQEAALEFMFFDLASCVIPDGDPPVAPGPK